MYPLEDLPDMTQQPLSRVRPNAQVGGGRVSQGPSGKNAMIRYLKRRGEPMIRQVTFALALMAAAQAYAQQPSWLPGAQYKSIVAKQAPAYAQQPSWLPGAQYDKSIVDQQELTWPTISSEKLEKFVGWYRMLPPLKYDVPYTGKLTLV